MESKNALIPTVEELNVYQTMARTAMQSKFFDKMGGEAGVLSIMLMARELGIRPMEALMGGVNVIMGKAEISPRLMNTMIRKAGHRLEIQESTNAICKIKGTRSDTQEVYSASYSIEDAKAAGLVKSGGGWEKYPSDMLFARCLSRLARRLFADVISSSYVEGELSDNDYVERSERMQPVEQPSRLQNVNDSKETIEVVELKQPLLTVLEFCKLLHEKTEGNFSFEGIDGYLQHLQQTKNVGLQQTMKQALDDKHTYRFCRSWKKWFDEAKDDDKILDETLK